jgi:outer membrane PBP1 activator LpoA protein
VPALRSNGLSGSSEIAGVTGRLHLDDHNRIRRDLEWAQMKGGAPNPL